MMWEALSLLPVLVALLVGNPNYGCGKPTRGNSEADRDSKKGVREGFMRRVNSNYYKEERY